MILQSRDIRSKKHKSCRLQRQGIVSAFSLCILRALQPYGLEAYKALKALVLAFAVLFCFERNGTAREIDRIPPPSGIFSVSRLDLNFCLRLPRLPQFSQKLLLLVIWRAKSYFCPFWTFNRKGRKSYQVPPLRLYAESTTIFLCEFVVAGLATYRSRF